MPTLTMKFLVFIFKTVSLIALIGGVIILGGCVIAGFLDVDKYGRYGIILDLLSHFRVQFLIGQFLILLPLVAFCRSKMPFKAVAIVLTGLHLTLIGLNGSQILPYYLPQAQNAPVAAKLRIFHLNVLGKNRQSQSVINAIEAANADILSLQEFNPWWRKTLEASRVLKTYPYRYQMRWGDDAIYSKRPFLNARSEHIPNSPHGSDVSIIAEIKLADEPVTLLFSHPPTPIRRDLYERQKMHFDFWMKNRQSYHRNLVIIGDLNTSPWSSSFRKLISETGLRDSQLGFGIQPSFPAYSILKRVVIDHYLISERFIVLNRQVGSDVGSDHYPVIVELGLIKTQAD